MDSAYYILFLVGIALIAIANLGFRSANSPGLGSGGFVLPWRARDRYTPLGFKLNLVGQAIWLVAAVLAGFILF